MKKTYINPVTKIVLLSFGHHICIGSPDPSNNPTNLSGITNRSNDPGNFSRRSVVDWDEDEEW